MDQKKLYLIIPNRDMLVSCLSEMGKKFKIVYLDNLVIENSALDSKFVYSYLIPLIHPNLMVISSYVIEELLMNPSLDILVFNYRSDSDIQLADPDLLHEYNYSINTFNVSDITQILLIVDQHVKSYSNNKVTNKEEENDKIFSEN